LGDYHEERDAAIDMPGDRKPLVKLTRRYSELFDTDVDVNTALNLADIESAGELGRIRQQGSG
jgi:hypothetical protein